MKNINPMLAVKSELVYRLFYPQVPAILCSKRESRVAAMPVVSAVSISNEPPLIGVSVRRTLYTADILRKSKSFSLNWIDYKKRRLIDRLTKKTLSKRNAVSTNKLKKLEIPYHLVQDTPILDHSVAFALIERKRVMMIGDHYFFVGKVKGAMATLDFDLYWKFKEYKPIFYVGSETKPSSYLTLSKKQS